MLRKWGGGGCWIDIHCIDIIPLISVSQMSLNQQKPIDAHEHIDSNKLMAHLPDDRFKILFGILTKRIRIYNEE